MSQGAARVHQTKSGARLADLGSSFLFVRRANLDHPWLLPLSLFIFCLIAESRDQGNTVLLCDGCTTKKGCVQACDLLPPPPPPPCPSAIQDRAHMRVTLLVCEHGGDRLTAST